MVTVFGTREPSRRGRELAHMIGRYLSRLGYTIVSGLARGIDTEAHLGATYYEGGTTIAVMAHGLHMVYPPENADTANYIVARGGALVSEHAYGVAIHRHAFPKRNRIQSGLSVASILVESGVRSGSMHTCRYAQRQGRLLLAVRPTACEGLDVSGAERAVHEFGAVPVMRMSDIERALANQSTSFQTEIRRG
jgi:DNA processing protein